MKQKKYFWQPELSMTIIYWSCTFAILFMSLILSLENTKPYLVSNIVMVVFFIFVFLGIKRYFKLTEKSIMIQYLLPFYKKELSFEEISTIKVGIKSIEINSTRLSSKPKLFIMTKKQKEQLIEVLKEERAFQDKIIYDDQLKLGEQ
ncbi:EbsA family protein [Enterococcus sp. BWB1-3]|uniref:EbsA family protein n=1 Tax=unclassified Enterococcus TaxID=2608891 RepID=UPI001920426B|nr:MULTISPECIES: EbsA family protein [unclassified Enterococcus]MBL1230460.1 EbsA family protein [Enterococcus sp. BWB1-3]MCB5950839.1 EbsA family protein [Enterococcus sp. BWT-B8]MCB5955279.1 EbsA family protein [Enterococcus sp. CWB-B31]